MHYKLASAIWIVADITSQTGIHYVNWCVIGLIWTHEQTSTRMALPCWCHQQAVFWRTMLIQIWWCSRFCLYHTWMTWRCQSRETFILNSPEIPSLEFNEWCLTAVFKHQSLRTQCWCGAHSHPEVRRSCWSRSVGLYRGTSGGGAAAQTVGRVVEWTALADRAFHFYV